MMVKPMAKKAKVEEKLVSAGSSLFRGAANLSSGDAAKVASGADKAGEAEFQFDAAGVEMERYMYLAPEEIAPFLRDDGLLNEFKMMYAFRHRFPLHYIVFKQTASNLPHEVNVELFSRAGALSDPNMDPHYLATLVMVGSNKKNFKPTLSDVKTRYYQKFRGGGEGGSAEEVDIDYIWPWAVWSQLMIN